MQILSHNGCHSALSCIIHSLQNTAAITATENQRLQVLTEIGVMILRMLDNGLTLLSVNAYY